MCRKCAFGKTSFIIDHSFVFYLLGNLLRSRFVFINFSYLTISPLFADNPWLSPQTLNLFSVSHQTNITSIILCPTCDLRHKWFWLLNFYRVLPVTKFDLSLLLWLWSTSSASEIIVWVEIFTVALTSAVGSFWESSRCVLDFLY